MSSSSELLPSNKLPFSTRQDSASDSEGEEIEGRTYTKRKLSLEDLPLKAFTKRWKFLQRNPSFRCSKKQAFSI